MKKRMYSFFTLILVCMLISSVVVPVNAAEVDYGIAPASYNPSTSEILKMEVNYITSFHTTINSSGKYFVDYELPSGATVYVTGKLTHTNTSGDNIKSGACYWDGSVYQPGPVDITKSGEAVNGEMTVADLEDGKTYYGYVKNLLGTGAVNGGYIIIKCY